MIFEQGRNLAAITNELPQLLILPWRIFWLDLFFVWLHLYPPPRHVSVFRFLYFSEVLYWGLSFPSSPIRSDLKTRGMEPVKQPSHNDKKIRFPRTDRRVASSNFRVGVYGCPLKFPRALHLQSNIDILSLSSFLPGSTFLLPRFLSLFLLAHRRTVHQMSQFANDSWRCWFLLHGSPATSFRSSGKRDRGKSNNPQHPTNQEFFTSSLWLNWLIMPLLFPHIHCV